MEELTVKGDRVRMILRWGAVLGKIGLGGGGLEKGWNFRTNESGCRCNRRERGGAQLWKE